jgi:hypothetical protein
MLLKWGDFATNEVDYLQIFMKKFNEQVGGAARMQVPLSIPDSEARSTFKMQKWCSKFKNKLAQKNIAEPIGSVDARILFEFNQPLLSAEGAGDVLPFAYKESGFNETNSLIWYYDLRKYFLPTSGNDLS